MDIYAIQKKADTLKLEYTVRTRKSELIRLIQQRLGQPTCFATEISLSCTTDCEWREDCQQPIAEWLR